MATNSNDYLRERPCAGFRPVPHYFASGDFVTYHFRNDRCFAQRVDDLLTVYLSCDTRELVGCKIKGVKHILDTAGDFGVAVHGGPIRLGFFFFVGAMAATEDAQKQRYSELKKVAQDATIDSNLVQMACGEDVGSP